MVLIEFYHNFCFPVCRKSIATKQLTAIPNPIQTYVHKSPNAITNVNEATETSSCDEKELQISMETLVSSFPQNNSLRNVSKIDELALSELVAGKAGHCALRLKETTQQKEMEPLLSDPSIDHCDRPSIELITIDPNPDKKQAPMNETNGPNSKDLMSHDSPPHTSDLLSKKGHGHKKSVSFCELGIPSTEDTADQKNVPCDSENNKDVVENIEAQIASKRPSKGNVLNRWNFTSSQEKQMIKSPSIGTNISSKADDGTSDGLLPKRGFVADIARRWNMPTTDAHTPNNLNPAAKTASDQCSTNQSKSPTQTIQSSGNGSAQSSSTNNQINLRTSSTQSDLLQSLSDRGNVTLCLSAADEEDSNLKANSLEQDSTQSHDVKIFSESSPRRSSHQQTLAEHSLLEEKNPFAYNLEALLNIPSTNRNQSRERDYNADTITQLSMKRSDPANGSIANTTAFSSALETITTPTKNTTIPFVLTLPSCAIPENGNVAPLNDGQDLFGDGNSDAQHFSPRASGGIGCISHKWFFPTSFSGSDPFMAFREAATALR